MDENGNELDDYENQWFIGRAIDEIWNYEVDGVYQADEEEEADKYGVFPGDFKIVDQNGDGKFTRDDKVFQGFTEPRFKWTLRNEFRLFNNLDVSFMIYSYWGHKTTFNQAKNRDGRSEEHTDEIQSLMRSSFAVFCLKKKKEKN